MKNLPRPQDKPALQYRRPSTLAQDIARRDSLRLQQALLTAPNRFLASIINWL